VTGRVYHVRFDPPPAAVANRVVQRPDDTEAVLGTRLREYREKTALVVPYYERLGLVRRIDGLGPPAEVGRRVLAAVGVAATVTA